MRETQQVTIPPVPLVGDGIPVACADDTKRPYLSLDAAASTSALGAVLTRVEEFLPWYSSVHRGAGHKSQVATGAYEEARSAALAFAGRTGRPGGRSDDVAIICRNTTEALNHLAYRLRLARDDVVVTTVAEHHANLLPWSRVAACRYVECGRDGTFGADDVVSALDQRPVPRLLAITGASNITGWMPPLAEIIAAAHDRGIPVVVDAAQLAPHRPLPADADFLAWSGHKMYAPFGAGVLVGPRSAFAEGDPFLAGGGAVDLVDLDEVLWTDPPEREEAGSPNVIGAVALHAAIGTLTGYRLACPHQPRAPDRAVAAGRPGLDSRSPPPRAGHGRRDAAGRHLHRRGRAARAGGRATGRRGGDRRPARLLLRASVPDAAPGPEPRAGAPLPGRGTPRQPQRDARSRPGQRRP